MTRLVPSLVPVACGRVDLVELTIVPRRVLSEKCPLKSPKAASSLKEILQNTKKTSLNKKKRGSS